MKTYVLTLSQVFPTKHPRKGEPTGFKDKFFSKEKIHTIRANYPLWEKRIKEIMAGTACLSIRQWSDKPYRSKQTEIARLTKDDGIGIERLHFTHPYDAGSAMFENCTRDIDALAKNDGLSLQDWLAWFRDYDKREPMAILHFTPYRYAKGGTE